MPDWFWWNKAVFKLFGMLRHFELTWQRARDSGTLRYLVEIPVVAQRSGLLHTSCIKRRITAWLANTGFPIGWFPELTIFCRSGANWSFYVENSFSSFTRCVDRRPKALYTWLRTLHPRTDQYLIYLCDTRVNRHEKASTLCILWWDCLYHSKF